MRLGKRLDTDNQEDSKCIIVVTGLPRSGTSMMMKILEAGGITLLIDGVRKADENNPRGYFEYELAKKLPEGDTQWLKKAEGNAVKIISALLPYLPDDFRYKLLFMERSLEEILASQRKMLIDRGKVPDLDSGEELSRLLLQQREKVLNWVAAQDNIESIFLNYKEIIENPTPSIDRLVRFLNRDLNISSMTAVIEPSLYRQRKNQQSG